MRQISKLHTSGKSENCTLWANLKTAHFGQICAIFAADGVDGWRKLHAAVRFPAESLVKISFGLVNFSACVPDSSESFICQPFSLKTLHLSTFQPQNLTFVYFSAASSKAFVPKSGAKVYKRKDTAVTCTFYGYLQSLYGKKAYKTGKMKQFVHFLLKLFA